jgi:hypothetical protein
MMAKMQPFWWFLKPYYPKPPYNPAAWNYDNLIGFIWLEGVNSAYDNAPSGQIEVKEPIGTDPNGEIRGGSYDNRT